MVGVCLEVDLSVLRELANFHVGSVSFVVTEMISIFTLEILLRLRSCKFVKIPAVAKKVGQNVLPSGFVHGAGRSLAFHESLLFEKGDLRAQLPLFAAFFFRDVEHLVPLAWCGVRSLIAHRGRSESDQINVRSISDRNTRPCADDEVRAREGSKTRKTLLNECWSECACSIPLLRRSLGKVNVLQVRQRSNRMNKA